MAYINLEKDIPGIRSLVMFRPETGTHLYSLAQVLLRGESPLSPAQRELIAAYVSHRNHCNFCSRSHAAAARCLYEDSQYVVDETLNDLETSSLSEKMKALLTIAALTGKSGKLVTAEIIEKAKAEGATDIEIHDTVLIAALFSLYNRYVDGMATAMPDDNGYFTMLADRLVNHGYSRLPQGYDHLKEH